MQGWQLGAAAQCSVRSAVAGRDRHVEHDGGVAGQVVDVARRGVDEQNLAVRAHPVA